MQPCQREDVEDEVQRGYYEDEKLRSCQVQGN